MASFDDVVRAINQKHGLKLDPVKDLQEISRLMVEDLMGGGKPMPGVRVVGLDMRGMTSAEFFAGKKVQS